MLVQVLPEQIPKYWKVIKFSIEQTFPEGVKAPGEKTNNALEELLLGKNMHAWICVEKQTDDMDYKILGVVVTSVVVEVGTKVRMLRVLSLFTFEETPPSEWEQGLEELKRYAKSIGCDAIDMFTSVPFIVRYMESVGGDVSRTYIQLELGD